MKDLGHIGLWLGIPLKKLAKGVLLPVDDRTELRDKDAVSGMEPKNEQKTEPSPSAIISWPESVFLPQAVKIVPNFSLQFNFHI